jgi:predicted dehydrogenase
MKKVNTPSRRKFMVTTGTAIAGAMILNPLNAASASFHANTKKRIAIVGTGSRALGMWSKDVQANYADKVEYVGLCDINPGRLAYVKKATGFNCPTFTDFEKMMKEVKPDILIVTTVDSTHHEFIIRGMELGANVITEKPMTTDEQKCEAILETEKKTGRPHRAGRGVGLVGGARLQP